MDFQYIKGTLKPDKDYPQRQHDLDALNRVLEGRLYAHLPHPFNREKTDGDEYIPIRERRPSVRYNLCRVVVDDSVALLFGDGHFPAIECDDEGTRDALAGLVKDTGLPAVMVDAATRGSLGSVVVMLRVLKARLFWAVMPTMFLTPEYEADAPDTLKQVREQYKVRGQVLRDAGYTIPEDGLAADWWFRRDFTQTQEIWYLPVLTTDRDAQFTADDAKTTTHGLGFVPMVWVRNLPGSSGVDGVCTFPTEAIDTQVEIDYQLSQAGRGLKYSSDPTLLIKEPAMDNDGQIIKGGGNALVVSANGDARLLEISGTASAAVIEYVRALREMALETAHGNRSSADKISAAQSGRAMELMNQSLIWLASKLRTSYGDEALLSLIRLVFKAAAKYELVLKNGTKVGALKDGALSLRWPHWYAPTYTDKQTEATTLNTLTGGRQMLSQETAVKSIASSYDIADPADELRNIEKDGPMPNSKPPGDGKKPEPKGNPKED